MNEWKEANKNNYYKIKLTTEKYEKKMKTTHQHLKCIKK